MTTGVDPWVDPSPHTSHFVTVNGVRRGHGRSETRPPYDADTLAEDLRQLLDSLSLPAVHLAGWCLGGRELTRLGDRPTGGVGT